MSVNCFCVSLQALLPGVAPPADQALDRLLVGVDVVDVPVEAPGGREGFEAGGAGVRFVVGVDGC